MIEIKNVSKAYSDNGPLAVDNLSLTVNDGEIFVFLGPNGAGKTTTIKMLTGILKPDCGSVVLDGLNILENPVEAKRTFSFVPDNPEIFSRLKVIEYLNFIGDVYKIPKNEFETQVEYYCEKFAIFKFLKNRISSLSHGTKQKLFICASLISNPKHWILDEPIVGLDPESAFLVKQIMRERADSGNSVFFSTHVMEVAEKLCDKLGIINNGKLIFTGTLSELKEKPEFAQMSLEQIFLNMTKSSTSAES